MRHGILFSSLLITLLGAVAGVFVLFNQEEGQQEIAKEEFVAGVGVDLEGEVSQEQGEQGEMEEEMKTQTLEAKSQASHLAPQAARPRPKPAPMSKPAPVPAPVPLPVNEKSAADPLPPPPPPLLPSPQPAEFPLPEIPANQEKININTADSDKLQLLNGIGSGLAGKIIDYRNSISLFYAIEDIKNVSGIRDAIFEKIKEQITVGNVSPSPVPPPPPPASAPSPLLSPPAPPTSVGGCKQGQVNVNTASLEEIVEAGIYQIGPSRAEKVVALRPFSFLQDLTRISGISEARVQGIIDQRIACVE